MADLNRILLLGPIRRGNFFFLMISLVLLLLVLPFFDNDKSSSQGTTILLSLVLVSALHGSGRSQLHRRLGWLLALPCLGINLYAQISPTHTHMLVAMFAWLVFLVYICGNLISFLLTTGKVDHNTIYAAVSVYLLMGVSWAMGYAICAVLDPMAFDCVPGWHDLVYFSFVTISTLGYGDILPINHMVRSLVILECVAGPLYIAILIASLVGNMKAQHNDEQGPEPRS